ncbi:MAG: hypothetical protein ACNI27_16665 [Desulfovibrio sp.]
MKYIKIFLIVAFIAIISLPAFLMLADVKVPQQDLAEKRIFAQRPPLEEATISSIEKYLTDNIPFRSQFIAQYMRTWEMDLRSYVRRNVKGKDGHYFSNFNIRVLDTYMGLKPLSLDELYRLKILLLGNQAFWQSQGCEYLSAYVPSKPTLYPEYLPDWIKFHSSWDSQIQQYLKDPKLNYLDFGDEMRSRKGKGVLLYNKLYDVLHWNGEGMNIAYEILIKRLGSTYQKNVQAQKHNKKFQVPPYGEEEAPVFFLSRPDIQQKELYESTVIKWLNPRLLEADSATSDIRLLMLTDSYFWNLQGSTLPIAYHVKKLVHAHYLEPFSSLKKISKILKPNVVFEVFVERAVRGLLMRQIDPRIMIAGEATMGGASLQVGADTVLSVTNAKTKRVNDGMRIDTLNGGSLITMPVVKTNEDGRFAVMAKIYAYKPTEALLHYSLMGEEKRSKKIIRLDLKKGINYIYEPFYGKKNAHYQLELKLGYETNIFSIMKMPEPVKMFQEEIANGI